MNKLKKIYIFLILLAVLASSTLLIKRLRVENNYKTYETVMELNDIKILASLQDRPYVDVAKDFLSSGVNSVVVVENTIDSLKTNDKFKISTTYSGLDLNIKGTKEGLKYIEKGIKDVIKDNRKIYYKDDNTLTVEGKISDFIYNATQIMRDFTDKRTVVENKKASVIEYMGLGYLDEDLKTLKGNSIRINLRPIYISLVQDSKKSIDRYINFIKRYSPNQRTLIFGSEEILGGEKNVEYLKEQMQGLNLVPVAIENSTQDGNIDMKGLKELTRIMDYQATRLFSTLNYIQGRYDYGIQGHHQGQEIMNTYYRAITERNIRMIYFRIFHFKEGDIITDMNVYKQRFDELNSRLDKYYGIKPISNERPMQIMGYISASRYVQLFAVIGIICSCLLLFDEIFKNTKKLQLGVFVASILSVVALYLKDIKVDTLNPMFALVCTISFSSLSVVYLLKFIKNMGNKEYLGDNTHFKLFIKGAIELIKCLFISFAGAILLVALYGKSIYMLEFSKFSGVKISQVVPLLVIVLAYVSIIGLNDYFDKEKSLNTQLREMMQRNVKVWQIALLFTMLGVLGIMIIRSGHSSDIEPSSSEIMLRNVLEYITPARPRNKAIFIGYPALILFVVFSQNKKIRPFFAMFALASTIGQTDLLNTFSHIRTPFMMSVYRIIGEYVIGTVVAFIIVCIIHLSTKIINKGRNVNA